MDNKEFFILPDHSVRIRKVFLKLSFLIMILYIVLDYNCYFEIMLKSLKNIYFYVIRGVVKGGYNEK